MSRTKKIPKSLAYVRETYSNGINIYTSYIFDDSQSASLKEMARELFRRNQGRGSQLELKTLDDKEKRISIGDEITDYIRPLDEKEMRAIAKEISWLQKRKR